MSTSHPEALWYTRCPVPTPLGLAAQLGWLEETFTAAGIAIRSIADSNDRAIRASHFDHRLDWSFRQGGNVPPIYARSNGRATRLVGITWTDELQAIVTLADSRIASVRDLAGARFGVARRDEGIVDFHRATALKGLASALALEGLAPKDVEIVEIPTPDSALTPFGDPTLFGLKRRLPYASEIAALLWGQVDAIFVKGTQGVTVGNIFGLKTVAEFGFHPDPAIRINSGTPRVLTVDETFASERPDLVARLIEVIARAGQWAAGHPEETRRFIAREAGASEEQVLAANGPDLHLNLGIGLDDALVGAVGHYKNFLRDNGFLAGDFDLHAWVDRAPLAQASRLGVAA